MKDKFSRAQWDVVKIANIRRADYNPKIEHKPGDPEYEDLKKSIEEFGQVIPFVINQRSGLLVSGHQTLTVLQNLGWTEANVIYIDEDDDRERALNSALNKIRGRIDEAKLVRMYLQLPEALRPLTGWNLKEIKEIELKLPGWEPHEDDFDVDAAVEAIEEPVTKPGDVIALGEHRLLCGDSTDGRDVAKLMAGEIARCLITSPPYFNQRDYSAFETIEEYKTFIFAAASNYVSVLDPNSSVVCWNVGGGEADNYDIRSINSIQLSKAGLMFSDCIVWKKSGGIFDIPRSMHIENYIYYPAFGYELVFVFKIGKMPHFDKEDHDLARHYQVNVWDIPQVRSNDESKVGHPAAFPIRLPELCMRFYSRRGEAVVDPFGGSGTTMVVAEMAGRRCYMMEYLPKYCDVVVARWEAYTGKKAVRP